MAIPDSSPADSAARFGHPTTAMVNGRFGGRPLLCLVFDEQSPELAERREISVDF
jgi:hypothetical protein